MPTVSYCCRFSVIILGVQMQEIKLGDLICIGRMLQSDLNICSVASHICDTAQISTHNAFKYHETRY